MNKLYVILPCFNESKNITGLLDKWALQEDCLNAAGINSLEVVSVNDGSTDSTLAILRQRKTKDPNLTVLSHHQNMGLGEALKTGLHYVCESSDAYDFVCIMDSDNTHEPVYIMDMLEKLQLSGTDCVIASRYASGAKVTGVNALRQGTSLGARAFYSLFLGIPGVKDYTCGYRLYRSGILKKAYLHYGGSLICERGFTCMVELMYKLHLEGAVFAEVPFELRYDLKQGASKMKLLKTTLKSFSLPFKLICRGTVL